MFQSDFWIIKKLIEGCHVYAKGLYITCKKNSRTAETVGVSGIIMLSRVIGTDVIETVKDHWR